MDMKLKINKNHATGPAAMPPPRSKRAPHFSRSVDDYIEGFSRGVTSNNCRLTDRQMEETVTCHTAPDLRDFWKSLDGYVTSGGRDLKRELLILYEGPSALRPYSE